MPLNEHTSNNGLGVGAIELTGDLEGCLTFYPETWTCTNLNGFSLFEETGREIFDGTLNGEEVIGDSGAFWRKTGLIVFYDIIPEPGVSGASNFYYSGYIA